MCSYSYDTPHVPPTGVQRGRPTPPPGRGAAGRAPWWGVGAAPGTPPARGVRGKMMCEGKINGAVNCQGDRFLVDADGNSVPVGTQPAFTMTG